MGNTRGAQPEKRPWIHAIIGLVVLAVVLAGGAYAWIRRSDLTHHPAAPLENVVIANDVYTGSCPVIAAQAKGYFKNEGVQAATPGYASGRAALEAVSSGRADLGISGELPLMFAVMDHRPLSVIATIAKSENDLGIISRKDSGISSPASLKGKRIGVTIGTSGHFFLDVFLTRHKLSVRDVTVRDLKPEALSGALVRGEIDAASTWAPTLGTLQNELGENGATFVAGDIYRLALNVVGSQTYVANHEQTLEKVLRALIRGADFCELNPDDARELVAGSFRFDAQDLKASWSDYRFHVTLDQSLLLELEDETRWAINNKLTGRTDMPNYLNHLHWGTLQTIAPAAVTVIH